MTSAVHLLRSQHEHPPPREPRHLGDCLAVSLAKGDSLKSMMETRFKLSLSGGEREISSLHGSEDEVEHLLSGFCDQNPVGVDWAFLPPRKMHWVDEVGMPDLIESNPTALWEVWRVENFTATDFVDLIDHFRIYNDPEDAGFFPDGFWEGIRSEFRAAMLNLLHTYDLLVTWYGRAEGLRLMPRRLLERKEFMKAALACHEIDKRFFKSPYMPSPRARHMLDGMMFQNRLHIGFLVAPYFKGYRGDPLKCLLERKRGQSPD